MHVCVSIALIYSNNIAICVFRTLLALIYFSSFLREYILFFMDACYATLRTDGTIIFLRINNLFTNLYTSYILSI